MKVNTSAIQGFAEMTAEEKLNAILNADFDVPGYIAKESFDKVSSQLAEAKRNLKAKMTEDEQQKLEQEQKQKDLEEKYNALMQEKVISEHKAKLLGVGFDEKLASETANALAGGDTASLFANMQKHLESVKQAMKAEGMKMKPPASGDGEPGNEEGGIAKMLADSEKQQLKAAQDALNYYTGGK